MKQPCLPAPFVDAMARPANPLVERALAAGRRALGFTCSLIPVPLLSVEGLLPLRLRVPARAGTPLADTYLSTVTCPYVRHLLEWELEGGFQHLSGWVFAASCDHGRRLYDNLRHLGQPGFVHILDVPHRSDERAVEFFADDLGELARHLADHFRVDTSRDALVRAIEQHNAHLARCARLAALRLTDPPRLSGSALHQVLVACAMAPVDRLAEPLTALCDELQRSDGVGPVRARLLVVGSTLDEPRFLELCESLGALVVGDRFCLGTLPGLEPIPVSDQPLLDLARHTLQLSRCPRMMDAFDERLRDVVAWARRLRADGIVVQTMKFCDLWGVEASALTKALRSAGWPVLRLEREYAFASEGQLRTRLQAFLESMER